MKANSITFDRIKKSPYKEDSKLNYFFRLQEEILKYERYCINHNIPKKLKIGSFIGIMSSTLNT